MVFALNSRFGSDSKAEIFRSQLQTKIRGKSESIPELAQSIKKMTRKAYPRAAAEVIDIIALDLRYRLRLREVGPKDITEAEHVAVGLETHRLADKQRGKHVRAVDQNSTSTGKDNSMENTLRGQISSLTKTLEQLTKGCGGYEEKDIKCTPVWRQ